jgi:hypothetical protein
MVSKQLKFSRKNFFWCNQGMYIGTCPHVYSWVNIFSLEILIQSRYTMSSWPEKKHWAPFSHKSKVFNLTKHGQGNIWPIWALFYKNTRGHLDNENKGSWYVHTAKTSSWNFISYIGCLFQSVLNFIQNKEPHCTTPSWELQFCSN